MAQQNEKQTGRSIEVRTLVLASIAAVTAAVVTSFFWQRGTLISTALTPVIVALTQEFLRRPAEKIGTTASRVAATPARGVTALAGVGARRAPETRRFDEGRLLGGERVANGGSNGTATGNGHGSAGDEAGGGFAAPPPPFDDTRSYDPARSAGVADGGADTAPAVAAGRPGERKVYGRKRFRWKIALLTGLAAFAIAAVALTASELALGGSVGGDGRTSLFGGDRAGESADGGGDEDSSSGTDPEEGAAPSDSSESQSVPEGDSESSVAPPEDDSAPEESVEPADPVPAEPVPAEPAPSE